MKNLKNYGVQKKIKEHVTIYKTYNKFQLTQIIKYT